MTSVSNDEPRIYRPPTWQLVFMIAITAGAGCVAWALRTDPDMRWVALSFAAFAVLGLGAIVECLVARVILDGDTLRVVRLIRRERYERSDIEKVVVEKAAPTTLVLDDGRVVRLPGFAPHANTLRAWLSRGS